MDSNKPLVERYCNLDFSVSGETAAALFSEIDREASADRLVLSDYLGPKPAHLTEAMGSWFDAYVAAIRQAALDEVEAVSGSHDHSKSGSGVFLERAIDRANDERIRQKRLAVSQARETNQAKYRKLEELKTAYDSANVRFLSLQSEHDRDPKIINPLIYIPALIAIGIAEALINFESFSSIKGWTPAIATGVTFVVACALAFSSHFWGSAIRHFRVLFDPAKDESDRWAQWQMMGLGTLTLSLVLSMVWYARNSYFSDLLVEIGAIGGEAPNQIAIIGGSMISNMIVWIVGVLLAYMLHDPDPSFPQSYLDRKKAESALKKMNDSLDAPLRKKFEQIDARAKNTSESANTRNTSLARGNEHMSSRRLFEKILSQDANVIAILNQYRGKLVHRASASKKPMFEKREEVYDFQSELLEPADYVAETIRLKYV